MPESSEHKKLRDEVANILSKYKWTVSHDPGDIHRPDIVATINDKEWKIEIEISGSNIGEDLEQGAETFVTSPDRLEEITLKVLDEAIKTGVKAEVVDIKGFQNKVLDRSII